MFSVMLVDDAETAAVNEHQGGGPMGGTRFFETLMVSKVAVCTEETDRAVGAWARFKEFSVVLRRVAPGDLTLHLASPKLKGFLELTYSVVPEGKGAVAQATLFYRTLEARKVEPDMLSPLLTWDDVGTLQDEVTRAIDCPGTP